jgi:L-ascorbate metabolism protein UlaG (beta-lactamase superfamily)
LQGRQAPARSELGIAQFRLKPLASGEGWEHRDLRLETTFANHTQDSLGFIFNLADNRIYFTGDTLFSPELAQDKGELDLLSVCINGKLGNMNLQEAARLTAQLQPRQVLPMHWGLFAENTLDPLEFVRLVEKEATRSQVLIPEPGVPVAL